MKNFLSIGILGFSLVLAACGGDSDSSGSSSQSFKATLGNKNVYSCPSKEALDKCSTDSSCQAAQCDLTYEAVTPVNNETNKDCNVSGNTITGVNKGSCKYVDATQNADIIITCDSQKMFLDGKFGGLNSNGGQFNSGLNLNGFKLMCP